METLRPGDLTWTALLGRWVAFAQAAVCLPRDEQGTRWRDSVPPVINLQAVTFALAQIDELQPDEQRLALVKAELLIRDNAALLERVWSGAMPLNLRELVGDAKAALEAATLRS
jgi:hypothetical protein